MRKLIIAVAIVFAAALSSCTKDNLAPAPTPKALKLADKENLSQAYFVSSPDPTTPPAISDKGNLSQADGDAGH